MRHEKLSIIFHGDNASNFRPGFERLLATQHRLIDLSEGLASAAERTEYENADVIIGVKFNASLPLPRHLRLFHAPAAGTDAIDPDLLPASAALCNCFGHEAAIAEYVMTALLLRHVPLAAADADLRAQRWTYWAGRLTGLRTELGGQTIGLLGFGHIAKAIAARAKAFGMGVHVANRSTVSSPLVDRYFSLAELQSFMGSADALVVSLPLAEQTRGLIGQAELAAMRPGAVILNVGRGPVIEEQALFDALAEGRIGGAIIDTWYQYPTPTQAECAPSSLDFASLPNVVMTPHMSGWTTGTVLRRQHTMADNIARLADGRSLLNVVRQAA
ncbi:MAG: phosphoglycerate dehydrogenase [Rhodoferax sp.]|nr:phosphoglycerate dehydrogenase [Rhodoferax sp.]